jgi:hypothetical protein
MSKIKIDRESAELEYSAFLERLNLSELKQSKLEEEKEGIIELIMFGYLIADKDNKALIIYVLDNSIGGENSPIDEIKFNKARLTVAQVEKYTQGTKSDMEIARRMLSALTGVNSKLFSTMDAEDFTNLGKVSAFFLPR